MHSIPAFNLIDLLRLNRCEAWAQTLICCLLLVSAAHADPIGSPTRYPVIPGTMLGIVQLDEEAVEAGAVLGFYQGKELRGRFELTAAQIADGKSYFNAVIQHSGQAETLTKAVLWIPQTGMLYDLNLNIAMPLAASYADYDQIQTFSFSQVLFDLDIIATLSVGITEDLTTQEDQRLLIDASLLWGELTVERPSNDLFANGLGGLSWNQEDQQLRYQPSQHFYGTEWLFVPMPASSGFVSVYAKVAVETVNDAPVIEAATVLLNEDESIALTVAASDIEGDALTFEIISHPSHGVLSGTPPFLSYHPNANYHGSDAMVIKANDGKDDSIEVTIDFIIQEVNDAPVGLGQSLLVLEDGSSAFTLTGNDVDGDRLEFVVVGLPSHGNLVGDVPNMTYVPSPDYHGEDAFQFLVSDGSLDSDVVEVMITVSSVNDAPVALGQEVATLEDEFVNFLLSGLDVDGDELVFTITRQPQHGSLSGDAPNLGYQPDDNYHGEDSLAFHVSDGQFFSEDVVVDLTVEPVNDAPRIESRTVYLFEDQLTEFSVQASDVDDENIEFEIVSLPSHGTVSGTGPQFTYQPEPFFAGQDALQIMAKDPDGATHVATISLKVGSVNNAPSALPISLVLDEDGVKSVRLSGSDPDGDLLTYVVTHQPINGKLTGTAPDFVYQPDPDFYGNDAFSYKVFDGSLNSEEVLVDIAVTSINDVPVSVKGTYALNEDHDVVIKLLGTDADGDSLTFEIQQTPEHGTLVGQAPNLKYLPDRDYAGSDFFTYSIFDGQAYSQETIISLVIAAINDPPVARSMNLQLLEDEVAEIVLTASDTEWDALTFNILRWPSHGQLVGDPPNLQYTPNLNFSGKDSFQFNATDGLDVSLNTEVVINVGEVNDLPVAKDFALSAYYHDEVNIPFDFQDPEGAPINIQVLESPSAGRVYQKEGLWYYVNTDTSQSRDSFNYAISDGETVSDTYQVSIVLNKASIDLSLSTASISELGGMTQLTVARSTHLDQPLTFQLDAQGDAQLRLPKIITIPAGSNAATIEVHANHDPAYSGDLSSTVHVRHDAFVPGFVQVLVEENDSFSLQLRGNLERIPEKDGSMELTVSVNAAVQSRDLVIALSANLQNQLALPDMVSIPSGERSVTFTVEALDNNAMDSDRVVRVEARLEPSMLEAIDVSIIDDEVSHSGRLMDGWIAGATVFFDLNQNRQLDDGEPSTQSDVVGKYYLNLPLSEFDRNQDGVLDSRDGILVSQGGVDISTGLAQTSPLVSSPSASIISPLTTLVVAVMQQNPEFSESSAASEVSSALGLDGNLDLLHLDPYEALDTENQEALSIIEATAKVQDTIVQVGRFLNAATVTPTSGLENALQNSLAKIVSQGGKLELEDSHWVSQFIEESAREKDLSLASETTQTAAHIISLSNQQKRLGEPGGVGQREMVEGIVRIQAFAQGEGAADLVALAIESQNADDLRAKYDVATFVDRVRATSIGSLNALDTRAGTFAFSRGALQITEDGVLTSNLLINRTHGNFGPADLVIEVIQGTALGGIDIKSDPIFIHFEAMEVNQVVPLSAHIIDDNQLEATETFELSLRLGDEAPFGSGIKIGEQGIVKIEILDDDAPGTFAFSTSRATIAEENSLLMDVFIERTSGSSGEVKLVLQSVSSSSTATEGEDYVFETYDVVFKDGVLRRKLPLRIVDDGIRENDETIVLKLTTSLEQDGDVLLGEIQYLEVVIENDDLGMPPTLVLPPDQVSTEDEVIGPLEISVADADTPLDALVIKVVASNGLLPRNQITLSKAETPGLWYLSAIPLTNGYGEVALTLEVSDGLQTSSGSFDVVITPQNDSPHLKGLPSLLEVVGPNALYRFEVSDPETPFRDLTLGYFARNGNTSYNHLIQVTRSGNGAVELAIQRPAEALDSMDLVFTVIDGTGASFSSQHRVLFGGSGPSLEIKTQDDQVVLSWEGAYQLIGTHDLSKPFQPIEEATSPYVMDMTNMMFFRLLSIEP